MDGLVDPLRQEAARTSEARTRAAKAHKWVTPGLVQLLKRHNEHDTRLYQLSHELFESAMRARSADDWSAAG